MSFGFGVGDFIAVSALALKLYNSFKGAPSEFQEISRQLESLHIVLVDLNDQSTQQTSLLNRNGVERKQELFTVRDNLMATMQDLDDIHKRYKNMGRISWARFEFGQRDLAVLRDRLTFQISTLNAFIGSLTIGALGRMEPMLERIYQMLNEKARESPVVAQTILSANSDVADNWNRLTMELRTEGIPAEYIQNNQERIRELVCSVVKENHLEGYTSGYEDDGEDDGIDADDSISQVGKKPQGTREAQNRLRRTSLFSTKKYSKKKSTLSTAQWLSSLAPEEEQARIMLMNHGFDLRKERKASTFQKIFNGVTSSSSDKFVQNAWNWAVDTDNKTAAKLLLNRFEGWNISNLHAAIQDKWDFVYLCLDASSWDDNERILSHLAAINNRCDILQIFLRRGISLKKQAGMSGEDFELMFPRTRYRIYSRSWTPLHFAAWYGAYDAAKLLLDNGIDANLHSGISKPPLELAAQGPSDDTDITKIMELFIERGAHINGQRGKQYSTSPLWETVSRGHLNATKLLLAKGASIVDQDYVRIAKNPEIARLLEAAESGHIVRNRALAHDNSRFS
ncbi:hypothetical protein EG329_006121 [Mollisiaceae sp. DMI_Dod_QoI]|nr:hypothetical protein EG329_006121 [Helotiales sp. DMI_Dod_QoI]